MHPQRHARQPASTPQNEQPRWSTAGGGRHARNLSRSPPMSTAPPTRGRLHSPLRGTRPRSLAGFAAARRNPREDSTSPPSSARAPALPGGPGATPLLPGAAARGPAEQQAPRLGLSNGGGGAGPAPARSMAPQRPLAAGGLKQEPQGGVKCESAPERKIFYLRIYSVKSYT